MKKYVVILTVVFLACFAGKSEARGWGGYGYRGGYCRGYYAPRAYVACYHPYYRPMHVWIPGYWGWDYYHRWVWFPGYWR